MSRWFRMYDDLLDDPKVQKLEPRLFKAWINLLCLASRNDGKIPEADDVSFALRMSKDEAIEIVNALIERGLMDAVDDEVEPHNWAARQFKSDRSTERSRKHRATTMQRDCNVAATVDATPPEQNRAEQNRTERDVVSASAETSVAPISKPKKPKSKSKPNYSTEFENFWSRFPAREGTSKADAWLEWVKLPPEDQNAASDALDAFVVWCGKQRPDYRPVHACRYLSQRRWESFTGMQGSPPVVQVPVLAGTDAFLAWERHHGKRLPTTTIRDPTTNAVIGTGWYFPTEFPQERAA